MKHRRGFTLVEVMVAVAIAGLMAVMGYAALRNLPRQARLSSDVSQLMAELSGARGYAMGRNTRTAVLFTAPATGPLRYFSITDPQRTLPANMMASGWTDFTSLGLAPSSLQLATKSMGETVHLHGAGFKGLANNAINTQCSAISGIGMYLGGSGGGYFPPPYCDVPADMGCTFCTAAGPLLQGAIVFEPDGSLQLLSATGIPLPTRTGSLAFSATDLPSHRSVTVALTGSGLIRSFSP